MTIYVGDWRTTKYVHLALSGSTFLMTMGGSVGDINKVCLVFLTFLLRPPNVY